MDHHEALFRHARPHIKFNAAHSHTPAPSATSSTDSSQILSRHITTGRITEMMIRAYTGWPTVSGLNKDQMATFLHHILGGDKISITLDRLPSDQLRDVPRMVRRFAE